MPRYWYRIRLGLGDRTSPRPYRLEVFDATGNGGRVLAAADLDAPSPALFALLQPVYSGAKGSAEVLGDAVADWLCGPPCTRNVVGELLSADEPTAPAWVWPELDGSLVNEPYFRVAPMLLDALAHNSRLLVRIVRGPVTGAVSQVGIAAAVGHRLKVLLVYSNPDRALADGRYPPMPDLERQFDACIRAFDALVGREAVAQHIVRNPSPEELLRHIAAFQPHVLVFAGHGSATPGHQLAGRSRGCLLCTQAGQAAELAFERLVEATNNVALRVAVLIACQSYAAADGLLEAGVPSVVGMEPLPHAPEFPVAGVEPFAVPFFRAISTLQPIASAFGAGLEGLRHSPVPVAALMPRLSMATADDKLFGTDEERFRARYLDALLAQLEAVPAPFVNVVGSRVRASDLYVPQTVTEIRRDDAQADGRGRDAGRAAMEESLKPVVVDVMKELATRRRLVVEAAAWTGKSTLCRHVVRTCAEDKDLLPIFIRFRDLSQSGAKTLEGYLGHNYADWLKIAGQRVSIGGTNLGLGEWVYREWVAGRALLVVDGVDEEFNKELKDRALAMLTVSRDIAAHPHILLTSRPQESITGYDRLQLAEFTPKQIEQLIRRCAELLDGAFDGE